MELGLHYFVAEAAGWRASLEFRAEVLREVTGRRNWLQLCGGHRSRLSGTEN